MKEYESLIVIDEMAKKEEIDRIVVDIIGLINKNGNVRVVKNLGIIVPKDNVKGHCFVFEFETELEIVEELEESYRQNEKIVYDLTVARKANN